MFGKMNSRLTSQLTPLWMNALGELASDIGFDLSKVIDETGAFRPHVAVFIGNEQQRPPDGAIVGSGVVELSVFPALSGG